MSVKFKIGFTMDAETLFSMISKFLPVQDLHVEEVIEGPPPQYVPPLPQQFVGKVKVTLPKLKRKPSKLMDLQAGINGIITAIMADGKPHHATEFKSLLQRRGFSPNSIGSRLQALEAHGIVHRIGDGTWEMRKSTIETIKESA